MELALMPPKRHATGERAGAMEPVHDDRFVVFIRRDMSHANPPDFAERPFMTCATYEEARRIQRHLLRQCCGCVIRYIGPAGGGD